MSHVPCVGATGKGSKVLVTGADFHLDQSLQNMPPMCHLGTSFFMVTKATGHLQSYSGIPPTDFPEGELASERRFETRSELPTKQNCLGIYCPRSQDKERPKSWILGHDPQRAGREGACKAKKEEEAVAKWAEKWAPSGGNQGLDPLQTSETVWTHLRLVLCQRQVQDPRSSLRSPTHQLVEICLFPSLDY